VTEADRSGTHNEGGIAIRDGCVARCQYASSEGAVLAFTWVPFRSVSRLLRHAMITLECRAKPRVNHCGALVGRCGFRGAGQGLRAYATAVAQVRIDSGMVRIPVISNTRKRRAPSRLCLGHGAQRDKPLTRRTEGRKCLPRLSRGCHNLAKPAERLRKQRLSARVEANATASEPTVRIE
jgi:hypothetical protein